MFISVQLVFFLLVFVNVCVQNTHHHQFVLSRCTKTMLYKTNHNAYSLATYHPIGKNSDGMSPLILYVIHMVFPLFLLCFIFSTLWLCLCNLSTVVFWDAKATKKNLFVCVCACVKSLWVRLIGLWGFHVIKSLIAFFKEEKERKIQKKIMCEMFKIVRQMVSSAVNKTHVPINLLMSIQLLDLNYDKMCYSQWT